jgi:ectoine hydroxylase-related dioxygenase (phytanoyl-CoA dioxygenase family)
MFSAAKKKMYSYLLVNKYNKKERFIDETILGPTKMDTTLETNKEITMDTTIHDKEINETKNMSKSMTKSMTKSIETIKRELEENGYCVVPNVYNSEEIEEYKSEFFKWYKNTENVEQLHTIIHGNGIFKYFEIGHQRFAWLARTNSKILDLFKGLWNTDELVTAFDGCCYYASEFEGKHNYWTHTDQSSRKKGVHCYQSFLSLTNNSERTLIVYKGSHLLHEHYFNTFNIDEPYDWAILDENYVSNLEDKKVYVDVKAGDLVLWDSRTFHQNTSGHCTCNEERLVQYLCYLPKNHIKNDAIQRSLRRTCFEERYTTSHWPYPLSIVPAQPRYNYYNPHNKIIIDYTELMCPRLDDLRTEIEKLL